MADDRYGGYSGRGGSRERDDSIFSDDDDRWGRGASGRWRTPGRGIGRDDRGFIERAGDEVRSWFGDEEAERRREMDLRRDERRGRHGADDERPRGWSERDGQGYRRGSRDFIGRSPGARSGHDARSGGFAGGGVEEDGGGSGRRDDGGQSGPVGRGHWDEHYRRWRARQIEQLDRDYEEYCRDRQQAFDQDFDSWRRSRLTEGGTASGGSGTMMEGGAGAGRHGGDSNRGSASGGTSRSLASGSAGEISAGGGTASATTASTGSSVPENVADDGAGSDSTR